VFEALQELIAGKYQLNPDRITTDVTLQDLGLDSLDVVELAMVVKAEWGAQVTDDDLNDAKQIGAIVTLIESRRAAV
jgi:acyl carrier protein